MSGTPEEDDDRTTFQGSVLRSARDRSVAVELLRRCRHAFEECKHRVVSGRASSRTFLIVSRIKLTVTLAAENSRAAAAPRTVRRFVAGSYANHWLRTDPDPAVVVIDLRKTLSGDLFLSMLDAITAPLKQSYKHSGVKRAVRSVSQRIREAPIRVAAVVLGVVLFAHTALALTTPDEVALVPRLVVALGVWLGLRCTMTWPDLRDGPVGRIVRTALFPPSEPADDVDE
jgi:hypothetical protein